MLDSHYLRCACTGGEKGGLSVKNRKNASLSQKGERIKRRLPVQVFSGFWERMKPGPETGKGSIPALKTRHMKNPNGGSLGLNKDKKRARLWKGLRFWGYSKNPGKTKTVSQAKERGRGDGNPRF